MPLNTGPSEGMMGRVQRPKTPARGMMGSPMGGNMNPAGNPTMGIGRPMMGEMPPQMGMGREMGMPNPIGPALAPYQNQGMPMGMMERFPRPGMATGNMMNDRRMNQPNGAGMGALWRGYMGPQFR